MKERTKKVGIFDQKRQWCENGCSGILKLSKLGGRGGEGGGGGREHLDLDEIVWKTADMSGPHRSRSEDIVEMGLLARGNHSPQRLLLFRRRQFLFSFP